MQSRDNQVDKTEAAGDGLHDAIQRYVQFVDNQRNLFIRQIQGELKQDIVNVVIIVYRLQAVIMFGHQRHESLGSVFADISAFQTAGDKIKLLILQQFANHNTRFMPG